MELNPNGNTPRSREELFAIAWRICNPDAPIDSPDTFVRLMRDAAAIGAFENRPAAPLATEETVEQFRTLITQWETRHPNHPAFRRCLLHLLAVLTAEVQAHQGQRS